MSDEGVLEWRDSEGGCIGPAGRRASFREVARSGTATASSTALTARPSSTPTARSSTTRTAFATARADRVPLRQRHREVVPPWPTPPRPRRRPGGHLSGRAPDLVRRRRQSKVKDPTGAEAGWRSLDASIDALRRADGVQTDYGGTSSMSGRVLVGRDCGGACRLIFSAGTAQRKRRATDAEDGSQRLHVPGRRPRPVRFQQRRR